MDGRRQRYPAYRFVSKRWGTFRGSYGSYDNPAFRFQQCDDRIHGGLSGTVKTPELTDDKQDDRFLQRFTPASL